MVCRLPDKSSISVLARRSHKILRDTFVPISPGLCRLVAAGLESKTKLCLHAGGEERFQFEVHPGHISAIFGIHPFVIKTFRLIIFVNQRILIGERIIQRGVKSFHQKIMVGASPIEYRIERGGKRIGSLLFQVGGVTCLHTGGIYQVDMEVLIEDLRGTVTPGISRTETQIGGNLI